MRSIAYVLFLLALLASLPNTSPAAERIILWGNDAKPPKVWNEHGTPKGILIDILHEIEKRTGIEFEIKLCPWARAFSNGCSGMGGVFGLSKTQKSLKAFDFSMPMYYDKIILVVCKGKEFKFESLDDLKGKTIGIIRGSVPGDEFAKAINTVFTPSYGSTQVSRLRMLLEGRVDAVVLSPGKTGLLHNIEKDPVLKRNADKFVCLEKPIARDANHIGFIKQLNRQETRNTIDKALCSMWADGTIERISWRYGCPQ